MRITIIYRLDDNDSQSTATSQIGLYPWPAAMKAPLPLSGFGRNESLVLLFGSVRRSFCIPPQGKRGKNFTAKPGESSRNNTVYNKEDLLYNIS